jgi:hypothetical protein
MQMQDYQVLKMDGLEEILFPLKGCLIFLTLQMVDAGFHYDPCQDALDRVSCSACSLVLEGWENGDDPLKEHANRRPSCPYLEFISSQKSNSSTSLDASNTKSFVNEIELVTYKLKDLGGQMPTLEERMMTVEDYLKNQQEKAKQEYIQESERILSHMISQGLEIF